MSRREMMQRSQSLRSMQSSSIPPVADCSVVSSSLRRSTNKSLDGRLQRSRSARKLLEETSGGDAFVDLLNSRVGKKSFEFDFEDDEGEEEPADNPLIRMRKQSQTKLREKSGMTTSTRRRIGDHVGRETVDDDDDDEEEETPERRDRKPRLRRGSSRRSMKDGSVRSKHSVSTATTATANTDLEDTQHTVLSTRSRNSCSSRRSSGGSRRQPHLRGARDTTIPSMDQSVCSANMDNDMSVVSLSRRTEGMRLNRQSSRRSMCVSEQMHDAGRNRLSLSRRTEGMKRQSSRRGGLSASSPSNRSTRRLSVEDDDEKKSTEEEEPPQQEEEEFPEFAFPVDFDSFPMDSSAPAALPAIRRSWSGTQPVSDLGLSKSSSILTSAKIKRNLSEKAKDKKAKLHVGELKIKPVALTEAEFANWESFQQNGALNRVVPKPTASTPPNRRDGLTKAMSLKNVGIPSLGLLRQKSYGVLGE